jgi:hypothetical protein
MWIGGRRREGERGQAEGRTVDGQATGEAGALAIQQSGHESTGWAPHPLRGFGKRCASHPPVRWSAGPPVRPSARPATRSARSRRAQ